MIEITNNPLNVSGLIGMATDPAAGGTNVFIGTIRNFHAGKGKSVLRLEYEAYEPMAISEIQKIVDSAAKQWKLVRWVVSHRVGTVLPGEVAVVVAVSTAHRKESFEACQYIIDQLKHHVPIWKKEVLEDGEEWVSAHP